MRGWCSGWVRLTSAGRLLADRAAGIVGRLDAASAELSAFVGLSAGRVRLAGYTTALSTLLPAATAILDATYPGDPQRCGARDGSVAARPVRALTAWGARFGR